MSNDKLIDSLLKTIFKGLLLWSGYCLFIFSLDFILKFNILIILADIVHMLPSIIESLMITIFLVSFYVLRLLNKRKQVNWILYKTPLKIFGVFYLFEVLNAYDFTLQQNSNRKYLNKKRTRFMWLILSKNHLKIAAKINSFFCEDFYRQSKDWQMVLILNLAVGRPQTLRIYP